MCSGHAALTIFHVPSLPRIDNRSVEFQKNSPSTEASKLFLGIYNAPFGKHLCVMRLARTHVYYVRNLRPLLRRYWRYLNYFLVSAVNTRAQRCDHATSEKSYARVGALRKIAQRDARARATTSNVNY